MQAMSHRWLAVSVSVVAITLGGDAQCASGQPMPTAAQPADSAAPPDLMQFVNPELRAGLATLMKTMPGGGMDSLTAEMLPQVRAGAEKYTQPVLPEPIPRERMIPGIKGSPDVHVYVIGAKSGVTRPAVLYIHGGGFILGSAKSSLSTAQRISLNHDCVVVSVDYRLAPETPFPGSLEDNYAALKWLHGHADELGVDRTRIALLGESAGGGHAAMLAIAARDRGELSIRQQILIYPMLDDRTGSVTQAPPWMGRYIWTANANRLGWSSLLGVPAGSKTVPAGSVPARVESLKGLPPTFIAVGSIDLFANENIDFARRLMNDGVATELYVAPGGFHGFNAMIPDSTVAKRFNAAMDGALRSAFAEPKR